MNITVTTDPSKSSTSLVIFLLQLLLLNDDDIVPDDDDDDDQFRVLDNVRDVVNKEKKSTAYTIIKGKKLVMGTRKQIGKSGFTILKIEINNDDDDDGRAVS